MRLINSPKSIFGAKTTNTSEKPTEVFYGDLADFVPMKHDFSVGVSGTGRGGPRTEEEALALFKSYYGEDLNKGLIDPTSPTITYL